MKDKVTFRVFKDTGHQKKSFNQASRAWSLLLFEWEIASFFVTLGLLLNSNILARNYFFLKNYITSEGAISHNDLYTISTALHYSLQSKVLC